MTDMPHKYPTSPEPTPDFRHQKFEWKKLKLSERSGVLMLIGAVVLLVALQMGASRFGQGENAIGYQTNIFTEILSVAFTILVLDRLAEMREERRLKERLIREAASTSNERAKAAIDDLRHYGRHQGWLEGEEGLLKGKNLSAANLEEAHFIEANLRETLFRMANLQGATLWGADMQGADLSAARMQRANMWEAYMQRAILEFAQLQGAILSGANLTEADLREANLEGVDFLGPFAEPPIMPNGEQWYEGMDLEMFTNPDHPNFYDPRKKEAEE